ncbi:hypothetical protein VKT23_001521 [Stygiomarasmius scandens]|uniref:Uncharacterized protein n=1 Tax=Marasmiellus scandens TaxID=2682957 RepID=A0ABR1K1S8_9AGAR
MVDSRRTDFYESGRVLGEMHRELVRFWPQVAAKSPQDEIEPARAIRNSDSISTILQNKIQQFIPHIDSNDFDADQLFGQYADELRFICATHTLSNIPGTSLLEEEAVLGTILSESSDKRLRKDRTYRMRSHVGELVKDIKQQLEGDVREVKDQDTFLLALKRSWLCWEYSRRKRTQGQIDFGANSFGLIALGSVLYCLDEMSKLEL